MMLPKHYFNVNLSFLHKIKILLPYFYHPFLFYIKHCLFIKKNYADAANAVRSTVMDILGRTILIKSAIPANYSFGYEFVNGTYMVEVTQGDHKKVLRLTKQ